MICGIGVWKLLLIDKIPRDAALNSTDIEVLNLLREVQHD